MKSRKQRQKEYEEKYGDIPIDYYERLDWMCGHYKLSEKKMQEIVDKRSACLNNLWYYDYNVIELLEEPLGQSRPRVRIMKSNFNTLAMTDPMVHVYVPGSGEDQVFMRKLVGQDLLDINGLINTPCDIEYNIFIKTPTSLNVVDTFLAEIGIIRPPFAKPDWDNIAKKYCDMFNHNIWLDDTLVIDGSVHKYYSILPRVEIKLRYLNCVYTKGFKDQLSSRKEFDPNWQVQYLDKKGELI